MGTLLKTAPTGEASAAGKSAPLLSTSTYMCILPRFYIPIYGRMNGDKPMSENKNEKNDEIRMNEYDETESKTESEVLKEYEQLLRGICKEEVAEIDFSRIWGAIEDAQEEAQIAASHAEESEAHAYGTVEALEDRLIALERAIEGILTKAKMVRRDADSGGDTEWY